MYRVTAKDRDHFMEKYFELRLADYLIQSYTRYGSGAAAEQGIVEAFTERNGQLEEEVDGLLEELGIPLPGKGQPDPKHSRTGSTSVDVSLPASGLASPKEEKAPKLGKGLVTQPSLGPSGASVSKPADHSAPVRYGTYRETHDPRTGRLTLVNLICVPSQREFEWMISHAAAAAAEAEKAAQKQKAAVRERRPTMRRLDPKEQADTKQRADSSDPLQSKDNAQASPEKKKPSEPESSRKMLDGKATTEKTQGKEVVIGQPGQVPKQQK